MFDTATGEIGERYRLITFDRRGWGRSPAGPDYRRTSIAEQAIEAAAVLRDHSPDRPATVVGLGLGGVVALELALAEPEAVAAAVMVEPPVLGPIRAATEGMSADAEAIREAAATGGEEAAYEIFLGGALPTLGAGAARFALWADRNPDAARAFLVELPAVPGWPLDPIRLAALEAEVTVAVCPSTPDILLSAADALEQRIPGCRLERTLREPAEAAAELLA